MVVERIRAKQENGAGISMLEPPEGVCADFRELEVQKQPPEGAKADLTDFHDSTPCASQRRVAELAELTDRCDVKDI
jgi:hypothetical protein